MMTKAGLIRKIAKRSGVNDSEAKIFFEMFLKKAAEMLAPGEALKLKEFGYFQKKKGIVKSLRPAAVEEPADQFYTTLMVYYPSASEESDEKDMIFNVPSAPEDEYYDIDSYFSLSIGKPVIPLKGVKNTEFFIPPSGNELLKLMESKAEKLLSEAEVIDKHVKGGDVLQITAETFDRSQLEINWEESQTDSSGEKENASGGEESAEKVEHIAWDFGEDISKQIEEEAILDVDKEETSLSWDFGTGDLKEPETFEEEKPAEKLPEEIKEKVPEETPDTEMIEEDVENEEEEKRTIAPGPVFSETGKFKRVQPLMNELGGEGGKQDEGASWDFRRTTAALPDEEADRAGFRKVHSRTSAFDVVLPSEVSTGGSGGMEEGVPVENIKDYSSRTKTRHYSYSQRRSPFVFVIAISTIIIVGVVLYMYLTKSNVMKLNKSGLTEIEAGMIPVSHPAIIERTFNVPVNYPYPKQDAPEINLNELGIAPAVFNKKGGEDPPSASKEPEVKKSVTPAKPAAKKTEPPKVKPSSNYQKVSDRIYRSGDKYILQVSSWKSESYANTRAALYKKEGLDAFVEKAVIPGKGAWYRVRIGGFNSVAEVQNFLKSHK